MRSIRSSMIDYPTGFWDSIFSTRKTRCFFRAGDETKCFAGLVSFRYRFSGEGSIRLINLKAFYQNPDCVKDLPKERISDLTREIGSPKERSSWNLAMAISMAGPMSDSRNGLTR